MPLPTNWRASPPFDNGESDIRDEKLAPMPRTVADTKRQLCAYYGMISDQDAQVGRVVSALQTGGHLANTVIIYTGDHGLSIGSHGLFGKQSVYEEAQRIPLIFSGPDIPAGKSSPAIAYGFDIFPTIFTLLDLRIPGSVEGKSLAGVIGGAQTEVRDTAFGAFIRHDGGRPTATQHAVFDGRLKLIRYDVGGRRLSQLFDLSNDPDETQDFFKDAASSKYLSRLETLLSQAQRDFNEPYVSRGKPH